MTPERLLAAVHQHGLTMDEWLTSDQGVWRKVHRAAGFLASPTVTMQQRAVELEDAEEARKAGPS